jgi:hypothetical protein
MQILRNYIFLVFLLFCYLAQAQQPEQNTKQDKQRPTYYKNLPIGKFLKETAKVGEPVRFSVVWKHAADKEVFFPDSTYNFEPFEFVSKNYFPTKTVGLSTDSVIYELATFETDSSLSFSLPVYVLNEKDTSMIWTEPTTLQIKPLLLKLPDSLKIIENTQIQNIQDRFNYWYWSGAAILVVALFVVLFLVFGGRIRKNYRLSRMRKQYQRFIADFDKSLQKYQQATSTEHGLSLWKSYLEGVLDVPFTSYTSKEIADIVPDKTLNEALKSIDRAIYGNQINEATYQALLNLKNYAQNTYETKIKEVQNV